MAWISVHEQVIGGKLRSLANEVGCSQNEALGLLVRLWLWGINNADPDGRIWSASKDDVADVLNIGIDRRYAPENAVEAMIKTRWIDFDDGTLYIHDWKEWQKQWYKALKVREDDKDRKAREREKRKGNKPPQQKTSPESLPTTQSAEETDQPPIPQKPAQRPTNEYPTDFEEFWKAYPRRLGKGDAYKCYKARLKDGWSPDELIQAARNYAADVARKHTEQEYIKHPKTFLSASTPFADYIKGQDAGNAPATDDEDPYAEWRR